MKKSMIMTCLTLMCMACAFAGCATSETSTKDEYYNNEEIVVGGGDVSTDVSISAVLIGAGEIYLKKTATKAVAPAATAMCLPAKDLRNVFAAMPKKTVSYRPPITVLPWRVLRSTPLTARACSVQK